MKVNKITKMNFNKCLTWLAYKADIVTMQQK